MRHDFSAHFLRVEPPDTSFSEAWESLCFSLLRCERGSGDIMRLKPPDKGIDIWDRTQEYAYQCKSCDQGALGSIGGDESTKSLETANAHRDTFSWKKYFLATNADYTGSAFEKLLEKAVEVGLEKNNIAHLGPTYWDELCTRHWGEVSHFFRYRISIGKERVVQAFKDARYYPQYVEEYSGKVLESDLTVVLTNNRTPLEVRMPFSSHLTVEHLLEVGQAMLGLSLEKSTYHDLDAQARPSLSVVYKGSKQGFEQTLGGLGVKPDDKIELWTRLSN